MKRIRKRVRDDVNDKFYVIAVKKNKRKWTTKELKEEAKRQVIVEFFIEKYRKKLKEGNLSF